MFHWNFHVHQKVSGLERSWSAGLIGDSIEIFQLRHEAVQEPQTNEKTTGFFHTDRLQLNLQNYHLLDFLICYEEHAWKDLKPWASLEMRSRRKL